MTEIEFLQLSLRCRHKLASRILRDCIDHPSLRTETLYRKMETYLSFAPIDFQNFKHVSDRYHMHMRQAKLSLKEHNLLRPYQKRDIPSSTPFLPIAIYLDNLRSAFNVGSIIRTTEAFRLGSLHFSAYTPFIDNPKVQKTSMWTHDKVPCFQYTSLSTLPRPLIALETADSAPSVLSYTFPETFTLLLGNEEYGLSDETLALADAMITIPLCGFKHSLNVASAFAIVAAAIREKQPAHTPCIH